MKIRSLCFLIAAYLCCQSLALANEVTLVTARNIYTSDTTQPKVEAFATSDAKIIATGSLAELSKQYPNATVKDYGKSTIVPGLIDAHGHLLGLGLGLMRADLVGSQSKADILARLKAFAQDLPPEQWLLGRGWDQNDWPVKELPTKSDLDEAFPDRPVWLERIDGHAHWGNSAAMAFAEQDLDGEWQPDGGEIIRDANGKASGVFIDKAIYVIENQVPELSDAESREALRRAQELTASVGLTGMHDAGTSLSTFKILQDMQAQDGLNVRVYAMADGSAAMLDRLCESGSVIDPTAMLTARSVKLYSDGALGSRGAALLAPYSDAPNNVGLLIEPEEVLTAYSKRAADCGLQVNIHAIGDRGNRVTLNALEAATQSEKNVGRHRVEHSQIIEPSDFGRFKELALIASVQPTHATSDMYWAEDRVGPKRIKGAYAWQTLTNLDIPLALGSDFPVERPHPLEGFYAAITRQDKEAWPEDGWYPSQVLTREQALHGFTIGAAYAAFQESQVGSIEIGKFADYTVLDRDIMTVPAAEVLATQIVATVLAGRTVFTQ